MKKMTAEDVNRTCSNCKNRRFASWDGYDYCLDYEMGCCEEDYVRAASGCKIYEFDDGDDEDYCPSATRGDYSPSNPWDAPGMSIKDFI